MFRICNLTAGLRTAAITAALLVPALAPAGAQTTKLVVQGGSSAPTMQTSPIYIATRAGFFKDENLEIEYRHSAGASQALQIVASGGADIASITFEPVIQGYEKGIRGKLFYQNYTRLIYFVAVPKDSAIQTVADLKGKKIGVASLASGAVVVVKSMLREAGLPATDDIFLPVGAGSAALAALRDNQVSALALWDSVYAAMETAGHSFRYLVHPTLGQVGNGGYFVLDNTLKEKRRALIGFGRAIAKATTFMLENPEAAVRIYWDAKPTAKIGDTEAEALAKGLKEMKLVSQSFTLDHRTDKRMGVIDPDGLAKLISAFHVQGAIQKEFPVLDIITGELVIDMNKFDSSEIKKRAQQWK